LRYRSARYVSVSLGLVAASLAAYAWHDPDGPPNGGSWLGYTLGGVSAALILWLMWLGVVKRQYGHLGAGVKLPFKLPGIGMRDREWSQAGRRVQGWSSAHVYLGTSLLLLVPLHSGFQFGWNIHTLAYALMSAVIATGVFGVVLYAFLPTPMARNRGAQKFEALLQQLADVDMECKSLVSDLPDEYARAAQTSLDKTEIGGGLRAQLARTPRSRATAEALANVRGMQQLSGNESEQVNRLAELLSFKQSLLERVQRHVRFRALLELWLILHVPLAFATLAALVAHVVVVFYYW
jgi:hypothetical protein